MTRIFARRMAMAWALAAMITVGLGAIFVRVETKKVPVARLAENIERQLKAQPNDVTLRLNLARLYAMAYALKVTEFEARPKGGGNLEAWFGQAPENVPGPVQSAPTREAQERATKDLERAITLYRDVVTRVPEHFIARLGLAWTLEQSGRKTDAVAEYRKVVELALPVEKKQKDGWWQEPATLEAIDRLEALLDPVQDAAELKALEEKAAALEPVMRMITPLAIPLRDGTSEPPLAPDARVLFDADGSGIPRRWSWISKDAGWLVYDADGTGQITSALQWFGSVTFWLFWSNGYEALAALDDSGDGQLRGDELRNLAIWHDRNQNGLSEKGEVRSLASHGIIALSSRHQPGDGVSVAAYSKRGVVFADGTTRTSYDVILRTSKPPRSLTSPVH